MTRNVRQSKILMTNRCPRRSSSNTRDSMQYRPRGAITPLSLVYSVRKPLCKQLTNILVFEPQVRNLCARARTRGMNVICGATPFRISCRNNRKIRDTVSLGTSQGPETSAARSHEILSALIKCRRTHGRTDIPIRMRDNDLDRGVTLPVD